jgi:hypothetical protein
MQPHAFEASLARHKRPSLYNPFNDLAQAPATCPPLSTVLNYYGVEIGARPTYERLPRDGRGGLSRPGTDHSNDQPIKETSHDRTS